MPRVGEGDMNSIGITQPQEVELEEPVFSQQVPTAVGMEKSELVKIYLLRFKLPSKYLVQQVKYAKTGGGFVEIRDFSSAERARIASALEGSRRRAYDIISNTFVYVESYGVWIAVSEEGVEKAREVSGYLRSKLVKMKLEKLVDEYYVKVLPVYLEVDDAKELLSEAYRLLSDEVAKLAEKIREAEKNKDKRAMKRLEKTLSYKEKLLESLRRTLSQLG